MKNNFLARYFSGVWNELKKVSWPTRQEVLNHTVIVVISATIAVAVTGLVDLGLSKLIQYFVETR
ncbi:MAG: preprotein translocase subunit SecE [Candidatus Berkelbacteria bacterium]